MTKDGSQSIRCFLSQEHPCNYLPEEQATSIIIDPALTLNTSIYSQLAAKGFRRSGQQVYQPHCASCHACIAVRIPVAEFSANRNQKRVLRANCDLVQHNLDATFSEEHYQLFQKYQNMQHPDAGMHNMSRDEYQSFIFCTGLTVQMNEFRLNGQLCAVSVTDMLDDALSAVYTFYDPELSRRSLGTYSILKQIETALSSRNQWLYLGYWIEKCQKMSYKKTFKPLEGWINQSWQPINTLIDQDQR